jgi:D-alanine--poly(phosphoribitol) ligase subunit 2
MKSQILDIIRNLKPEFTIDETTQLVEGGYLDSFDIVSLVVELEAAFDIKISGIKIRPENFKNIDAIIRLIKESK